MLASITSVSCKTLCHLDNTYLHSTITVTENITSDARNSKSYCTLYYRVLPHFTHYDLGEIISSRLVQ